MSNIHLVLCGLGIHSIGHCTVLESMQDFHKDSLPTHTHIIVCPCRDITSIIQCIYMYIYNLRAIEMLLKPVKDVVYAIAN